MTVIELIELARHSPDDQPIAISKVKFLEIAESLELMRAALKPFAKEIEGINLPGSKWALAAFALANAPK